MRGWPNCWSRPGGKPLPRVSRPKTDFEHTRVGNARALAERMHEDSARSRRADGGARPRRSRCGEDGTIDGTIDDSARQAGQAGQSGQAGQARPAPRSSKPKVKTARTAERAGAGAVAAVGRWLIRWRGLPLWSRGALAAAPVLLAAVVVALLLPGDKPAAPW